MAKSTAGPGARKIQGLLQKFHAEKSSAGQGPAFMRLMRGMMVGAARARAAPKKAAPTVPTRSTASNVQRSGVDRTSAYRTNLKKTFGSF